MQCGKQAERSLIDFGSPICVSGTSAHKKGLPPAHEPNLHSSRRQVFGVLEWYRLGDVQVHVRGARAMPSFVNMSISTLISENLYNLVHCKSPFAGWAHS